MSEKKKKVAGFDIPLRELTAEEAVRKVTADRIKQFNLDAGEEYCDQAGYDIPVKVFAGFLLAKHPELAPEIVAVINSKYGEVLNFIDLYREKLADDSDSTMFYTDLAQFVNLCPNVRKRVNQVLIQVHEHYNRHNG